MEDALEVQTQEYYVTNILTKNNNILWTIFNLSVLLRLFRKENIELIEIKKKNFILVISYWGKLTSIPGTSFRQCWWTADKTLFREIMNSFQKMQAILF